MKKLFIYALLILSGFALPACGEEDPEPKTESATIEGKWYVTRAESQSYDANNNQISNKSETNYPAYTLTFNAPSEFKEDLTASPNRSATGSYTLSSNALTLTNPSKIFMTGGNYQVDSLTADRLVIRKETPAGSGTLRQVVTYRAKR